MKDGSEATLAVEKNSLSKTVNSLALLAHSLKLTQPLYQLNNAGMTIQCILFGTPTEVTNPGDDSRSFLFPFTAVDKAVVGAPEEARCTSRHRLVVTITRSRLVAWNLADETLMRVLFEVGRRELAKEVRAGRLAINHTCVITTVTHSCACPFDPARISTPEGYVMEVEEERRIGIK